MRRAYLDHASNTTLRSAARDAMLPFLGRVTGDPGRLHAEGREARVALELAREEVAAFLRARPREVVFTSNGTESVNTAVWGALARAGPANGGSAQVVTTAVEHSSVLDACRRGGVGVVLAGADRTGRVDPDELLAAVGEETVLVSVQLANHEVGARQPVAEIAAALRGRTPLVHVDACAAAGHVPVDFAALDVDLLSVTAHKLGGPAGAAALLVRRGLRLPPLVLGGAQERARRGGIEDVAACAGFGAACAELAGADRLASEARAADSLLERARGALGTLEGIEVFGPARPDQRLPHLLCLGIAGVEAEPVLIALDQHGVAVHSGSSCSSELIEPSPVLAAMGVDAQHSLRVSVGWDSTPADVDAFAGALASIVPRLRELRAS